MISASVNLPFVSDGSNSCAIQAGVTALLLLRQLFCPFWASGLSLRRTEVARPRRTLQRCRLPQVPIDPISASALVQVQYCIVAFRREVYHCTLDPTVEFLRTNDVAGLPAPGSSCCCKAPLPFAKAGPDPRTLPLYPYSNSGYSSYNVVQAGNRLSLPRKQFQNLSRVLQETLDTLSPLVSRSRGLRKLRTNLERLRREGQGTRDPMKELMLLRGWVPNTGKVKW